MFTCSAMLFTVSWRFSRTICPVLPRQAHGDEFANFIVRPHMSVV
jgi:hypothetical protein